MTHAQFREWFKKESKDWKQLECSPHYICEEISTKLEKLPDVAAELEKIIHKEINLIESDYNPRGNRIEDYEDTGALTFAYNILTKLRELSK